MTSILLYTAVAFVFGFAASTALALRTVRNLRARNAAQARQLRRMRNACALAAANVLSLSQTVQAQQAAGAHDPRNSFSVN